MSEPALPLSILARHLAILGMTGSGKTSTGKLAIEQVVAAGFRVCILDPVKSDHWGLISSASGKRPGLPFTILGGPHGHLALHSSAGAAIAELVGAGKLPLSIIDMADFEPGGLQRFFVDFSSTLLKRMKGVLYLVIEEAHEFAPKERAGFDKENLALHYAKKLATAGRSKGIRLIVMTQRTQSLHNALLGSCASIIAHQLAYAADQEPVLKWLKGTIRDRAMLSQVEESLASLPTGTGWVCSGEAGIFEKRAFPRIQTFDNSATPEDDEHRVDVKTADVDLDALRTLIGTAVDEAEANDPKKLKARIAELERQVTNVKPPAPVVTVDTAQIDRLQAEVHELWNNVRIRNDELNKRAEFIFECRDALVPLQNLIARLELADGMYPKAGDPNIDAIVTRNYPKLTNPSAPARAARTAKHGNSPPVHRPAAASVPRSRANGHGGDSSLGKGERAVLTAIAQHADGVDREQITVLTGYKRSTRDSYVQRLGTAGLIQIGPTNIFVTAEGVAALGSDFEPLPTGAALRDYWLGRLPAGERAVFETVVEAYPNGLERDAISTVTSYKRSTRDSYIQRLGTRKLVESRGGIVFASERLFG